MTYQLSPELDRRVQDRIASGAYHDAEDLFRNALDALEERDQEKRQRWHERNHMAMEQSRQGLSEPLEDEAVLSRLRSRLAKEGILDE